MTKQLEQNHFIESNDLFDPQFSDRIEFPIALESTWENEMFEVTKESIEKGVYLNWISGKEAKIEEESANYYSVEFSNIFGDWKEWWKMKMYFNVEYTSSSIILHLDTNRKCKIEINGQKVEWSKWDKEIIIMDEWKEKHYDIVYKGNWKSINFDIKYNEYETERQIIEKIKKQGLMPPENPFLRIDKLENTQLTWLNNPTLWKEVFKDENGYYRKLFYSAWNKKKDITNVYFNEDWKINTEKTEGQGDIEIMWINVKYSIDGNGKFSIDADSQEALIDKVKKDKSIIVDMVKDIKGAIDLEMFSWLSRETYVDFTDKMVWQFKTEIISLEPVFWIYSLKLSNEGHLDPLYCKVDNNNLILVDESWKKVDQEYLNYKLGNKKEKLYYKFTIENWSLKLDKMDDKLENQRDTLPTYTWDLNLNNWTLTSNYGNLIEYTDREWNLIANIPCHKTDDWEFVADTPSEDVDPIKLYKRSKYSEITAEISTLAANLWITETSVLTMFKDSFKKEELDFTKKQEVVEVKNLNNNTESIYYKLSNKDHMFDLTEDANMYSIVERKLKFIKERLSLTEKIKNSSVWYKNYDKYEDFEGFLLWRTWVWKKTIDPNKIYKFVSWNSDDLAVDISRWSWSNDHVEVIYTADKNNDVANNLKSEQGDKIINISWQNYKLLPVKKDKKIEYKKNNTVKTVNLKKWDITIDPVEVK